MKFNTVMRKVAVLDCLESLAAVARQQGYVRPTIATEQQQVTFSLILLSTLFTLHFLLS
jgi:DNA mismatch repair ATPase MutS